MTIRQQFDDKESDQSKRDSQADVVAKPLANDIANLAGHAALSSYYSPLYEAVYLLPRSLVNDPWIAPPSKPEAIPISAQPLIMRGAAAR